MASDSELALVEEGVLSAMQYNILAFPTKISPGPGSEPAQAAKYLLPAEFTPLIGREQDVTRVCTLLQRPEVRLLTLVGTGGVGKTRLALAVAQQMQTQMPGGVCFVELAAVSDPALVLDTLAQELTIQAISTRSLLDQIMVSLREKRFLLLLDNFEQVVAAAPLLENLLAACLSLKILVTSRAVLHLRAEYEFPVSPLTLPDLAQLPEGQALSQYTAVALFIERAQALLPAFKLTSANARTIAEICARLDGLPLAIELAAARIKLLPPQALLSRLSQRLQLLTRSAQTLPARQQTLRNTLKWSYDLLTAQEQLLFRLLSVFAGGFTVQAAELLYTSLYAGREETLPSVFDGIDSLINSSLLQPPVQEDAAEEPRLGMLETVREYSQERLIESGEQADARRAHAELFLGMAEEAAPELQGAQQANGLERLEREHDNLRAAMEWMLEAVNEQGQAGTRIEMALRLGKALEPFWRMRGYPHEGRAFMDRALNGCEGADLALQARALRLTSDLYTRLGELDRAEALLEKSLECYRKLGDKASVASALRGWGWIAHQKGLRERAYKLYEEALALFKELNHQAGVANTLLNMAYLVHTQGNHEQARALYEEVLKRQRALGDKTGIFSTLYQLGQILLNIHGAQAASKARVLLEEGRELAEEVGDKRGIASMQAMLGRVAYSEGDMEKARQLVEECLLFYKEGGDRLIMADYLSLLAQIATAQGNYAEAHKLFKDVLAAAREVGDKHELIAVYLEGKAELALAQGYYLRAARLWGAAKCLRTSIDTPGEPSERILLERKAETVRGYLGEQAFATAWAEGCHMTAEEILAAPDPETGATSRPITSSEPIPAMPHASSNVKPLPVATFHEELTTRELEVLRLLAQGLTDAQIAEKLVVSTRTVNTHVTSIYRKLQLNSRSAATRYALEHNLF